MERIGTLVGSKQDISGRCSQEQGLVQSKHDRINWGCVALKELSTENELK